MTAEITEFEIAPGRSVGGNNPVFIIAEIGQNHQGSYSKARRLIQVAAECGVECVKFQKSDLDSKFTPEVLNRPYAEEHSFGATYGEHKRRLELSFGDYVKLKQYAEELGLIFTASGMDKPSIDFLESIGVPFFKIGSADTTNLPLLRHVRTYNKPIVISTGMQTEKDVTRVYQEMVDLRSNFALLQCTSAYPTPTKSANLNVIKSYQLLYPRAVVGYSGHEEGCLESIAAVAAGAKIIERHITLDHNLKGSDHASSLNPAQLKSFVKAVKKVDEAMGKNKKDFQSCENPCFEKLAKTIVATRHIPKGAFLTEEDLDVKVALTHGFNPCVFYDLLGRKLKNAVQPNETLTPVHLE